MSETYVARTCTRLDASGSGAQERPVTAPLSAFRSESAYVLLGDAGAGKSTELSQEYEELGDAAVFCTARDFVTFDVEPEWRDKTLFIDGLDEIRAGTADRRPALDEIRTRLAWLDWPSYRISCREADWLGSNDRRNLKSAAPGETVAVLRLDPLDEPAVEALLADYLDEDVASGFRHEAEHRGLGGMLTNPLTLELLIGAVAQGGGSWPASQREIFELACERMTREHNDEHIAAAEVPPSVDAVMTAAGELCAIQLLAGTEGFSLGRTDDGSGYVALDSLQPSSAERAEQETQIRRHALATKLFSSGQHAGTSAGWPTLTPLHRHIAEFLGGRYLAHLVENGFPARRAVALMISPHDGRVVTSLRGLSAWFAAHSAEALDRLVDADPVGIGLYGDIGHLQSADKLRVLQALDRYATDHSLLGPDWQDGLSLGKMEAPVWAFRSLAVAELSGAFRELLATTDEPAERRMREFALALLSAAEPAAIAGMRVLLPEVLAVARDVRSPQRTRLLALDAWLHLAPHDRARTQTMKQLLETTASDQLTDPDNQLAGTLLNELYPTVVAPEDIWRFLLRQPRPDIHGRFGRFWDLHLVQLSDPEHIGRLLDALADQAADVVPAVHSWQRRELAAELLALGLEHSGEKVEVPRLLRWLNVVAECLDFDLDREERERSFMVRALEEFGLSDAEFTARESWSIRVQSWLHARPQLLEEMLRVLDDSERAHGPARETIAATTGGHAQLRQLVEDHRRPRRERAVPQGAEGRGGEAQSETQSESARQQRGWADRLRSNLGQLEANTFSAESLEQLSRVFLGVDPELDRSMSGAERLAEFIGGDEELIEAVLNAFRASLRRPDLPDVDETVALFVNSEQSLLAYPALAGLDLLDSHDPDALDKLGEDVKRKALAAYYCIPESLAQSEARSWHVRWLSAYPGLIEEVAFRFAEGAPLDGGEHLPALSELNGLEAFEELQQRLWLRLLRSFPPDASSSRLAQLDRLLHSAMTPPIGGLGDLITHKLGLERMTVDQLTRWRAAAALLFEGHCVSELVEHAQLHRPAVSQLAELLRYDIDLEVSEAQGLTAGLSSSTLGAFIELLGSAYPPLEGYDLDTADLEASFRTSELIFQLSQMSDAAAGEALRRMEQDSGLREWRDDLRRARESHSTIRREAEHRHPAVIDVQRVFRDGAPANAADLAALLLDRLDDIAQGIRGGSSNPWRMYWNEDRYGRPEAPKPEDSCRDALLVKLKPLLPGVDLAPEGHYAANKRSDIRASCIGFNIPVEIKRESHANLWTAMHTQLMAKYTTDGETSGFGIYLVFWFGGDQVPALESERLPIGADELRGMLEARLSHDEALKIAVRVIDVTEPGA